MMKKKRVLWLVFVFSFIALLVAACHKLEQKPIETDWRDLYGTTKNVTVIPESSDNIKTNGIDFSSIELLFPTPLPKRDFVPKKDQTELVLWMFGEYEKYLDDHIVAELNYMLQERGYSFYLTKHVEEEEKGAERLRQISRWQEALDAGEIIDLIFLGDEDGNPAYEEYGNTAVIRTISGGYLLPFSEYPETESKKRLLTAYPKEYWKLSSFRGDIYGVSNGLSDFIKRKNYLMLNLDAAEQAGIEIPEKLDVLNLDGILQQAENAGIPGIEWADKLVSCGVLNLKSGLFLKYLQKGEYRIENPLEDKELLSLWDALYRYKKNGWQGDSMLTGSFPLIISQMGTDENWQGDTFFVRSERGECSARVKIYEERERFVVEGQFNQLLAITSSSQHKEEAVELLSLMHGDEEIVQLLRYGIEGVHYRIGADGVENVQTSEIQMQEYGYIQKETTWKSPNKCSFGNRLMYVKLEEQLGKENMEDEWYEACEEIEIIPFLEDFTEEQKEVQKRIKNITVKKRNNGGITNLSGYLILLEEDYKEQIDNLHAAFGKAGYNKLAEEINKAHGLR